jgi:GH25 family lysozyme M1 (1,4-beta-N-acetylmuramidase)
LTDSSRRVAAPRPATLIGLAVLMALCLYAAVSVAAPSTTLGATAVTKLTACSGVSVRTSASTGASRKASLKSGLRVVVVATVTGGSWKVNCTGKTVSGKTWYRISSISGRSVKSIYKVTYVYAATGLFKNPPPTAAPKQPPPPPPPPAPPVTRYAACGVNLRTSASTSAAVKTTLKTRAKVTVVATVSGTAWSASCPKAVSGKTWYRISAINGTTVLSLYKVAYLYAASGLFTSTPPPAAPPPPPPPPPVGGPNQPPGLTGIDVSHWQNTIDWTKVAGAGYKFAFVKASESTNFVDPNYVANRAAANAAGVTIGAYHFARPSAAAGDAVAEADWFLQTAQMAKGDLLPVLDLETAGGLNDADLQAWVAAYLGEIQAKTGVAGVIYTSPVFWQNYVGDTEWFADNGYKVLWIAHWTAADEPTLPANDWGGNGWTFWQYSNNGTVPGIGGRVDLDVFNGASLTPVLIP